MSKSSNVFTVKVSLGLWRARWERYTSKWCLHSWSCCRSSLSLPSSALERWTAVSAFLLRTVQSVLTWHDTCNSNRHTDSCAIHDAHTNSVNTRESKSQTSTSMIRHLGEMAHKVRLVESFCFIKFNIQLFLLLGIVTAVTAQSSQGLEILTARNHFRIIKSWQLLHFANSQFL